MADGEADPVDGLDGAVLGEEVGLEALDLEERSGVGPGSGQAVRGHHQLSTRWRGSRASLRPSPMKLAAITTRIRVIPG